MLQIELGLGLVVRLIIFLFLGKDFSIIKKIKMVKVMAKFRVRGKV